MSFAPEERKNRCVTLQPCGEDSLMLSWEQALASFASSELAPTWGL
jgi:hypothetical protein